MKFFLSIGLFLATNLAAAQSTGASPKLIVGIVVDQMRWDFLYRYSARYRNDGIRRLLREGFSCENTFIPYTPTVTAVGHTTVYTGSVPALHGVIGNNWYDKNLRRVVYCTDDDSVYAVGSSSAAGKMSPKNMWSNTITDELRIASNFRNKTIAISLKDRGAILPGGHTANAAYWFDNSVAGWITSSYYMTALPVWLKQFNDRKLPDTYLKQNWTTLYPINTYKQSTEDDKPYESRFAGITNTFPHITDTLRSNRYEAFKNTPQANTYTFDMAKAAIEGEALGKTAHTDFLAVSLSTPDYVGHAFGPNSIEIEDVYLRLDKDMADFLRYLDTRIGKGQYLIFLTADHGVAHVPGFAEEHKMPGRVFGEYALQKKLSDSVQKRFGVGGVVSSIINYQVYLDNNLIEQSKTSKKDISQYISSKLLEIEGVANAFPLSEVNTVTLPSKIKMFVSNGYNQQRSGDVQFILKPQWFSGGRTGTTHGLWNPYDSHIPLLWFGWKIKPGKTHREVYMSDIAPTLAAMLKIQMPNASVGEVILEVIDSK
ncbi:MAG TPA: alkaline phosphatase PafA [Chitinophagaceae bacterium]|nr:alkaline phosphatase PafA [Chitinophagaceae bacterium]